MYQRYIGSTRSHQDTHFCFSSSQVDLISIERGLSRCWIPSLNCTIWDCYENWLQEHGYTLHPKLPGQTSRAPTVLSPPNCTLPYAIYLRKERESLLVSRGMVLQIYHLYTVFSASYQSLIAYAQDSLHREVVIKVAPSNSEELKIYKALLNCKELYDPKLFPSVLPPLDVLSMDHDVHFIILPRCEIFEPFLNLT